MQISKIKLGGGKTSYFRVGSIDPVRCEALDKWSYLLVFIYRLRVVPQKCGHIFPQGVRFFYEVSCREFSCKGIQLFALLHYLLGFFLAMRHCLFFVVLGGGNWLQGFIDGHNPETIKQNWCYWLPNIMLLCSRLLKLK